MSEIIYSKLRLQVPQDLDGEDVTITSEKGNVRTVELNSPITDIFLPGMEKYNIQVGRTDENISFGYGQFAKLRVSSLPAIYDTVKYATSSITEAQWVEFCNKGCIAIALESNDQASFIGKTITIANSQTPNYSNWKIADFNHDNSKNTVDLIASNTVTTSAFGSNQTYYGSTVESWLNGTYANGFSSTTKQYMGYMHPYIKDKYDRWTLAKALSGAEVGGSNTYLPTGGKKYPIFTSSSGTSADSSRIRTGASSNWWLRSPNTNGSNYDWYVGSNGALNNNGSYSTSYGVVPCIRFRNPNKELDMSWAEIKAAIQNGTFSEYANVGDTKSFVINGKTYHAEVVAINDGTGSAAQWYPDRTVDFICTELYETTYPYNSSSTNSGGFPSSALKNTLINTVFPILPQDLKDVIIEKSHSYIINTSGSMSTLATKLWLPTFYEIVGDAHVYAPGETSSNNKQYDIRTPIKMRNGQTSAGNWWLGSLYSNSSTGFWYVYSNGAVDNGYATASCGVPLCFRIG